MRLRGHHEEIAELYKSGLSAEAIARKYESHHTSILKSLQKQGVPRRPCGGWRHKPEVLMYTGQSAETRALRKERRERWIAMYISGMTAAVIARQENVSHETVRRGLGYTSKRARGTPKEGPLPAPQAAGQLAISVQRKAKKAEDDARIERLVELSFRLGRRKRLAA